MMADEKICFVFLLLDTVLFVKPISLSFINRMTKSINPARLGCSHYPHLTFFGRTKPRRFQAIIADISEA